MRAATCDSTNGPHMPVQCVRLPNNPIMNRLASRSPSSTKTALQV